MSIFNTWLQALSMHVACIYIHLFLYYITEGMEKYLDGGSYAYTLSPALPKAPQFGCMQLHSQNYISQFALSIYCRI